MPKAEIEYPIDFVITWVDGNDPKWQEEYCKYKNVDGDQRSYRFRDMGILKYWFRGVEKYAPWVNKVYFVTCGQKPEWLNTDHPKLICINHKDFIPTEYLPTFSSHTIELNLHRIGGLSDHFVYFNDDTFLTSQVKQKDFFAKGLPCDSAVINYAAPREEPLNLVPFVNAAVINRNFSKKKVMKDQFFKFFSPKYGKYLIKNIQFSAGKFFPGFKYFHQPSSFLKKTYLDVWEKEFKILDSTCKHKFRVLTDVNQWLLKDWQVCTGNFTPRSVKNNLYVSIDTYEDLERVCQAITNGKYKMICPNDTSFDDFETIKNKLDLAFSMILSSKSSYEL